jgi:hypothetical protein
VADTIKPIVNINMPVVVSLVGGRLSTIVASPLAQFTIFFKGQGAVCIALVESVPGRHLDAPTDMTSAGLLEASFHIATQGFQLLPTITLE